MGTDAHCEHCSAVPGKLPCPRIPVSNDQEAAGRVRFLSLVGPAIRKKHFYSLDAKACMIGDLPEASFGPEGFDYIDFNGQLPGAIRAVPMLRRSYRMLFENYRDSASEREPGSNQMT